MAKPKAFKIADSRNPDCLVGVVARGLDDLLDKSCKKFGLSRRGARLFETDGTAVEDDDYLFDLVPRTRLIVVQRGQHWTADSGKTVDDLVNLIESIILRNSSNAGTDMQDQIDAHRSKSEELAQALEGFVSLLQSKSDVTARKDDPQWFEGVQERFRTKEAQMKYTAKTRIRGYLVTAREYVASKKDLKKEVKDKLGNTLKQFEERLKEYEYFEYYFDRTAYKDDRLCKEDGWFRCEGKYNEQKCAHSHTINPYGSRAERLLFTTWNLDHVIEKSREVLPSLVDAATESVERGKKLNWEYFFECLFTTANLKLVHISCHMKDQHVNYICDQKQFFLRC